MAIGMVQLTKIAEEKGLSPMATSDIIKDICTKYDLPTYSDVSIKTILG